MHQLPAKQRDNVRNGVSSSTFHPGFQLRGSRTGRSASELEAGIAAVMNEEDLTPVPNAGVERGRLDPVRNARTDSPKFEPAVRWLARLALEGSDVGLADVQLAAAALACPRGLRHERAEKTLLRLL
jgi:hypothetical protein